MLLPQMAGAHQLLGEYKSNRLISSDYLDAAAFFRRYDPKFVAIDFSKYEILRTGYAGFDRSTYPGDATMIWIWENTNLCWVGFYLAPAPQHGNQSWMHKYEFLKKVGYGFAPVYVGHQVGSPNLTAAQGTIDGRDAASLSARAGFPRNATIYLDIEQGPPLAGRTHQIFSTRTAPASASARKSGSKAAALRLRATLSFRGCCLSRHSASFRNRAKFSAV